MFWTSQHGWGLTGCLDPPQALPQGIEEKNSALCDHVIGRTLVATVAGL